MSKEKNLANQQSNWLSQVYEVHDKEAVQINGGVLADTPTLAESSTQEITSSFEQLFQIQSEILEAKLEGKVLGTIISAYNDALAFIK